MKQIILIISLFLLATFSACKSEPPAQPQPQETQEPRSPESVSVTMEASSNKASPHSSKSSGKTLIDVPDDIQSAWSAVELEVIEKETDKKETYTIKKGEEITIKYTDIKIKATHFIPNFTMGGGVMTSLDANPENPAVNLVVTESGKEIWNGVAFMQFPDTHAFEHEKYIVIMKNYIAKEAQ